MEDRQGVAESLNNLGGFYSDLGDAPKALEHFEKSLRISEEIGDKASAANTLSNIGYLLETKKIRQSNGILLQINAY